MPAAASVMPVAGSQILDALRCRQDKHHPEDGHGSEALEGEGHIECFYSLDKIRLNLFKSRTGLHIFP